MIIQSKEKFFQYSEPFRHMKYFKNIISIYMHVSVVEKYDTEVNSKKKKNFPRIKLYDIRIQLESGIRSSRIKRNDGTFSIY